MIEILKSDAIVEKVGGKFRLTALIQRRLKELVEGARPLVDIKGKTLVQVVAEEIMQDKIAIDYDKSEGLTKEMSGPMLEGMYAGKETEEATG